jgi:hypothetical protein
MNTQTISNLEDLLVESLKEAGKVLEFEDMPSSDGTDWASGVLSAFGADHDSEVHALAHDALASLYKNFVEEGDLSGLSCSARALDLAIRAVLLIEQAQEDGTDLYNDCEEPETLSPNTYDGDGESFSFTWNDGDFSETGLSREEAKEIYLDAFWRQIDGLQQKS